MTAERNHPCGIISFWPTAAGTKGDQPNIIARLKKTKEDQPNIFVRPEDKRR
jgi:hypothetical protein